MSAVLELKNVSKIMEKKALVEDISFTINKGEIFGFRQEHPRESKFSPSGIERQESSNS